MKRLGVCLLLSLSLTGCVTYDEGFTEDSLIPNKSLQVSPSFSISAEAMAAAGLAYLAVDPLAPNWAIEERRLDPNHFRIALKMKRFTTGGDGEAAQVFHRRADQIAMEVGSGVRYRVIEYTEGIESQVPIAQRVAQGVIEIIR